MTFALLLLLQMNACGRFGIGPPFIHGTVIEQGSSWGYLIAAAPGSKSQEDTLYVRVTRDTHLQLRNGRSARAADLQVGRQVSVWITDFIVDTDPGQVDARRIVIWPP